MIRMLTAKPIKNTLPGLVSPLHCNRTALDYICDRICKKDDFPCTSNSPTSIIHSFERVKAI